MSLHHKYQLFALLVRTDDLGAFFEELFLHAVLDLIEELTFVGHIFEIIKLVEQFYFETLPRIAIIECILFHFDKDVRESVA